MIESHTYQQYKNNWILIAMDNKTWTTSNEYLVKNNLLQILK